MNFHDKYEFLMGNAKYVSGSTFKGKGVKQLKVKLTHYTVIYVILLILCVSDCREG